jgi:hypothetical protein
MNNSGVESTYTETQGQYLAFIYYDTKIHGVPWNPQRKLSARTYFEAELLCEAVLAVYCAAGSSRVNSAPLPGPSLRTFKQPPSSLAAKAALCRPNP